MAGKMTLAAAPPSDKPHALILRIRVLDLRVVFMLSGANQGLSIRRTIYQIGDSSTPSAEMSKNDQLD